MARFPAMGEKPQHSGAGLSIQEGNGLSAREFYENEPAITPAELRLKIKKTGPDSQEVTERPGEFR